MELPTYFDPNTVRDVWTERAMMVAGYAEEMRAQKRVTPASSDRERIAAFGIDCQIGFCSPGSSLFVPGAVEDTQRTVEWIYRNLERLTTLVFSLDTHFVHQIFHPAFWTDARGRHPEPFSVLTRDDVSEGKWQPRDPGAIDYLAKLEAQDKYRLTIWPYHTMLGGVSHALVPALMEAAIFHAVARETPTVFETKGENALTENYSVLAPEVTEVAGKKVGAFNEALFETLLGYDKVYVFGQAKSHCVLSTLRDLVEHVKARDPKLLRRIHVLEDATSPVSPPPLDPLPPSLDFPAIASRAFDDLAREGVHMVTTQDPI